MKFNKPLYYCTECKAVLPSIDKLFFVEEKSSKGFCSEACIEDFYTPLIRYFENTELNIRINFGIETEKIPTGLSDKQLIDDVLVSNDEIWKMTNELDEEIFTYIKHYGEFSGAVICKVYEGHASFIFLSILTQSRQLLAEIRSGQKIEKVESEDNGENEINDNEDFNFMQLLENKKSKLLAELLEERKNDDIPFEDFMEYESSFSETLESPDEVFENRDNEGDSFFIYIKSYVLLKKNFFYIISCLKRKDNDESLDVSVFPVLAFPTNDLDLYAKFRSGKRIAGHLKN